MHADEVEVDQDLVTDRIVTWTLTP